MMAKGNKIMGIYPPVLCFTPPAGLLRAGGAGAGTQTSDIADQVCKGYNKEHLSRITELMQEFGIPSSVCLPWGSVVNMCD